MHGITLAVAALLGLMAANSACAGTARFAWYDYKGVEDGATAPPGMYRNPILAGFYPDPSVIRQGSDYYMVNSTFSWFPGIPVWHSRDLVHWRQIGNAIDRPDQLDFGRLGMSMGVFAPAISFHAGRFYIVNTCVGCGGNFVITASNAAGPWSAPKFLPNVAGIDPSLFFDDDGSAWLVHNAEPEEKPRYPGHTAIWLHRFDLKTLAAGPGRMIVDGGVDPAKKPFWVEGPHLYKKDGYYYLMAAEGGTAEGHSEVIFRADTLDGAFRPAPSGINPILTQRDLPEGRPAPVASTGHADLVQTQRGDWWAVFLGTRPYQGNLFNTGRETFLLPVSWRDGWPTILPHGQGVPHFGPVPALPRDTAPPQSGTFETRNTFGGSKLGPQWLTMRGPMKAPWRLDHGLVLTPSAEGIGDNGRPSFVGRRQQHADATVTTCVIVSPGEGESAGIAAVQNDDFFLSLALTRVNGRTLVRVTRRAGAQEPRAGRVVADVPVSLRPGQSIQLRLHARAGRYDFDYATSAGNWRPVAHDVDGTNLSTAKAGGFVGTIIGLFAQAG